MATHQIGYGRHKVERSIVILSFLSIVILNLRVHMAILTK